MAGTPTGAHTTFHAAQAAARRSGTGTWREARTDEPVTYGATDAGAPETAPVRPSRFVEHLEKVMILVLLGAIVLIAQRSSIHLYRFGLATLIGATLLQIAVGNLPKDATPLRALRIVLTILTVVVVVFGTGILLVPFLSQMGR